MSSRSRALLMQLPLTGMETDLRLGRKHISIRAIGCGKLRVFHLEFSTAEPMPI